MSTYLLSFVAGDFAYVELKDKAVFPVSIRIYFSPELGEFIDHQKSYIFPFITESIKFYERYFQTECPWGKYDMVFCPEFTVGAMEYPGCVTYNDKLLFRTKHPSQN